jgi:hypothetical protein
MKKLLASLAVLGVLTACGGGDGGGRPSEDEIADALKDTGNPAGEAFAGAGASEEAIDCIAKVLHDSDLSDEALEAIVEGDEDYKADEDDTKVSEDIAEEAIACVTG